MKRLNLRLTRKRIILIGAALVVLALVVYAFLPDPVPVQTALVRRDTLRVIVEEEGQTAVSDAYAITAPVTAFVRRIELEVGDAVTQGQPVARLESPRTPILDPGSRSEAAARVRAAEATARQAAAERERIERLAAGGAATRQQLEQAVNEAARASAELEGARAALRRTEGTTNLAVQEVLRAPVAGRVLAVRRRSEGQVNPGDTLLVVGNTQQLEVRADVLSQDAVRIRAGTRVIVDQWGGDGPLEATVHRVEPQGFTSVSSLGVEEQRVIVAATLTSPAAQWTGTLGSGYRVLARFIIWEGENVLQVPSSALFRVGENWAVFVVQDGKAVRKPVTIGQQAGLYTEIVSGLQEGEEVIVHPPNTIADGVAVASERES